MPTSTPIQIAMVLAAGYGKRMRPLTDTMPKPMIPVLGKPMIDRVLDHLERARVSTAVVNLHHLGEKLEAHLQGRRQPEIVFSHEDTLLETGGGVRHAIAKLGDKPFIVANSDTVWLDGPTPALERLRRAWDGRRMDALLMLYPTIAVPGYDGSGDYFMDPEGRLTRRGETQVAPFVFTGVQILHPKIFKGVAEGRFSLVQLYDQLQENGRLFGMRHDGEWYHVGTPQLLAKVERVMTSGPAAQEWL
ncbi:MAG: nucleotidyltransferase family protein [Alphaproteobacteria bacterium]|nr:nucleotidyltransferase family protein [Alphaproteobacteria bacterium]